MHMTFPTERAPAGGVEACAWELRNSGCSMHTALVDVRTSTGRRDHAIISLPLISDDIVLVTSRTVLGPDLRVLRLILLESQYPGVSPRGSPGKGPMAKAGAGREACLGRVMTVLSVYGSV